MQLYTLAQIREKLWAAGPVPKTPYVTASQSQKDQFDEYLNQACMQLLAEQKPRYSMRRINVPVYDRTITLPRELDSIDGIQMVNESNCPCNPLQIYSRFHEWAHPVGACCCDSMVYVLDETAQSFITPSPGDDGYQLKVVATEPDTPDMYFVGGYDADWDQIFDTETLAIGNGSFTTTTIWKSMPQIQKPVTTNLVQLYSVDVATSDEELIAVYAPGETIPAYKRYKVPEWNGYPLARVFGKICFVEATADRDIPFPNNLRALKLALKALNYEDNSDMDRFQIYWNQAMAVLDNERSDSEDAELPTIKIADDFGSGMGKYAYIE